MFGGWFGNQPTGGSLGELQGTDTPVVRTMRKLVQDAAQHLNAGDLPAVQPAWHGTAPHPVTVPRGATYQRAPAENQAIFEQMGGVNAGLMRSILREVDTAPFALAVMRNHNLSITGLVVAGFVCSLRSTQSAHRTQQLILEVMAPELPLDMAMATDQARAELERVLGNVAVLADAAWFTDGIEVIRRAGDRVPPQAAVWDIAGRNWVDGTTLAGKLGFLVWIAENALADRYRNRAVGAIILTVVAFAVRGNLTTQKLGRIVGDLQQIIPYINETLNSHDLRLTWANFGHLVDDRTMPGIMRRWLGLIPAQAIRLRVILAQSAGSGLTSLDVIARAIHEHPHFPWTLVRREYPEEWDNAGMAIQLVGGNPYYGYRRDLTEVRSTRFKHLAALCGDILIAHGDKSLENYRGFVKDRARTEYWTKIVDGYVKATVKKPGEDTAPITNEDMAHHQSMLQLVAAYPANTGGQARMDGHPGDQGQAPGANM